MAAVVKFPERCAGEPDRRFCGLCGRRVQPLLAEGDGFGPCIEGASNVIDCGDVRRAVVQAHRMAAALERPLHPEWQAFVARLGIPAELIAAWLAKAERVAAIEEYLRRGVYGMEGGAPFLPALDAWMAEGDDADEKLIALINHLRCHLDPAASTGRPMNLMEINDWHDRLGKRAADLISEVPDYEPGEE